MTETFTARSSSDPITGWVDRDGVASVYADHDPATGLPWTDEADALTWAETEVDAANVTAANNAVLNAAVAVQASFAAFDADPATDVQTTVVYEVHRIVTAWGNAIEAEVLEGYSVVGQLALRTFDPWDGAIPFADVDGRLIATVVGIGNPDPLYPWEYGIWVEGIALDHKTMEPVQSETWLATRLIVDGLAVGGGSVPA